jgi:peroxisomal coenzyme A diphosphatase NUDT7
MKHNDTIIGKSYKYLSTAVMVPLITLEKEKHLLFEQRNANIIQGSEVCFPGGRFDAAKDRSLKDTAIRETCEELGIHRKRIRVKEKLGTLIAPVGVMVEAYVGKIAIRELGELNINRSEVEEVFTLPLAWFKENPPREHHLNIQIHPFRYNDNKEKEHLFPVKDYALPQRYEEPWSGRKHPVFVYQTTYGVIWGITAELVREYIKGY